MQEDEIYTLEKLIKVLEECRDKGSADLNFPKAFYCLAIEIKKIKEKKNKK